MIANDAPFVVTDPATWIARGRRPDHAARLAQAWVDFPDLPPTAPIEDRMARTRARVDVMKPLYAEMDAARHAEQNAANFAFVERKAADGSITDSDVAILTGRDRHALDWHHAVSYSKGWYAAHVGSPYGNPGSDRATAEHRRAYDLGFADGGGNPDDLFDAARRTFTAAMRADNQPPSVATPLLPRPLPSSWTRPTDQPKPARWERRLLILSGGDALGDVDDVVADIHARPGADAMTIVRIDTDLGDRLRAVTADRDFDEVFVAAEGAALALVDEHAAAIPLCKTMERTCNTPLQQRAHLNLWLERAASDHGNVGAGHIRWGKLAQGLTGKLGEFTARYAGKAAAGHQVVIQLADRTPATGYVTADGTPLDPVVTFGAKARMRREMERALRAFGGATRL